MLKLAGVVILYYPDKSKTIENIATYANQLNKLYIFDNSAQPCMNISKDLAYLKIPIEYISKGTNEGISKRLNEASHKAIQEEYDFLLTMDQDSSFEPGAFELYKQMVVEYKKQDIAQFGVNFQKEFTKNYDKPIEVLSLITSGSIINLNLFDKVGGFDEKLFIDFVDAEYSYRVNFHGFKILQFTNIILNHRIGEIIWGRSFKNFKKTPRIIHSPIRVYYIIRNGLYLIIKHKNINKEARVDLLNGMKVLKNNFIYHPKIGEVYLNALQGIFDFLRNKMGKK